MKLLGLIALVAGAALAAEKKVKFEQLPPAVQAAVREQTKNATLVGLSAEKEKGKTVYEVETEIDGKSRDLLLDQTGTIVVIRTKSGKTEEYAVSADGTPHKED
jgi:uncharacterized membrane protein YkoI